MSISKEQSYVVECIKSGYSVVVDSCPGSGKSSTVISVANALPTTFRILQITYNSMLRKEFRDKIQGLHITNMDIHTYHSLAVRYFLPDSYTDTRLRYILHNKILPKTSIPLFDLIVIDEAQDMSLLYFRFIKYFISCMKLDGKSIQVLILGDYKQRIYEYKGADSRFLTLADILWSSCHHLKQVENNGVIFKKCSLHTSYRITNSMGSFVNHVLMGDVRIKTCREGVPVKYIRNSRYNIQKIVIHYIRKLIESGDKPGDFFILGASIRSIKSNIRKLENVLVSSGIPVYIPAFESDKMDERVIQGKVVFSTFHTIKGRERKHVFIIDFDNSYFTRFARSLPRDICPNTLYVGATRATETLFLLENDNYETDRPLEFMHMSHHEMKTAPFIDFTGSPRSIFYEDMDEKADENSTVTHYITPTELVRFISESVLEELTPLLDTLFVQVSPPITKIVDTINLVNGEATEVDETEAIELPNFINTSMGLFEDVSDITGIAIPCMYYDRITGGNILYKLVKEQIANMKSHEHSYLKDIFSEIDPYGCTSSDYLYLANVLVAVQEKLYFKLRQIGRDEYTWITEKCIKKCIDLMQFHIGDAEKIVSVEETIISIDQEDQHVNIDEELKIGFKKREKRVGKEGDKVGNGNAREKNVKYRFTARVDTITQDTLWEIKCTTQISVEHQLQVIIYDWLWRFTHQDDKKDVKIINIKTGEVQKLVASDEELTNIIVSLLSGKYKTEAVIDDDEFLRIINENVK
jgi:hypothetical protein